jgi:hypothetical protein
MNQTTPPESHPVTAGYRRKLHIIHATVAFLSTVGGAVLGFIITLALVVLEARFGKYIFGMDDLLAFRWDILPIPIGAVAGYLLGRRRPHAVSWATACGLGGLILGGLLGAFLGPGIWGDGVGAWAGGVVGGALGLLLGTLSSLRIRRIPRHPLIVGTAGALVFLGSFSFAVFGATNLLDLEPLDFPELASVPLPKPDSVDAVVFLIGDAGATERNKTPLLSALQADVELWSAALHRDSAVSIVYAGDNVYPNGVRDRDDPGFPTDSVRLWSQIRLVDGPEAKKGATVGLFVTGNHDWGNTVGSAGFDRVRNQSEQLRTARAAGHFVSLLPEAGDPGPVHRDLRRNVRIIFFDTHWFLQERSEAQRIQFFERLRQTIDGARDREVILVAHHPYYSAGPHGAIIPGYHTLGIAYILKQAGALVQDLNSPPYDELLAGLRRTFDSARKPPLIYAGGHDHSLQVLAGAGEFDPRFVLVSGAGSKLSSIQMGPGLVWGGSQPGYMMLVFRKDDGVDLFVLGGNKDQMKCAGNDEEVARCMEAGAKSYAILYAASLLGPSKQPRELTPVEPDSIDPGTPWWTEEVAQLPATTLPAATSELLESADSFTTPPGRTYPAGRFRRFVAGDLNREVWSIPVRLPILDLATVGGGLHPLEVTGGQQTVGLRFLGRNGREYDFRPIVKNPTRAIPEWLRRRLVVEALDDQMAAQFPFGPVVVAELLKAVGIDAPKPVPVVMPNDPRLGQYRALFAGRVGLFAPNAEEGTGGAPGFAGYTSIIGSDSVYANVGTNPESTFDDRHFLKARLIDLLVGDWDRHSGQWRWGERKEGGRTVWRAIPKDRDWAFARIDGLTGRLARLFYSRYVGFSDAFPSISRLAQSGNRVDHRVLNRLALGDFIATAREVQSALTDSVVRAAVAALPPSHFEREGARLVEELQTRLRDLVSYSEDYYRYLTRSVQVFGFAGSKDVIEFERQDNELVLVRVRSGGPSGPVRFTRIIDGEETKEVLLFIQEGEDQILGNDDLPFKVRMGEPPEPEVS